MEIYKVLEHNVDESNYKSEVFSFHKYEIHASPICVKTIFILANILIQI